MASAEQQSALLHDELLPDFAKTGALTGTSALFSGRTAAAIWYSRMVLTVAIHEFTASRRKAQAELHVCSELTFSGLIGVRMIRTSFCAGSAPFTSSSKHYGQEV